MTNYIRNNAWNGGGGFGNQDLLWYAKGVQKMMSRALDDPASWWFFAAIHGEYVNPDTEWFVTPPQFPDWGFIQGPPAVPTSPLPNGDTQALFWNQCQHGTWYFLPWHRGYLMALEAQLRADIVSLGGPADWALPYWDYFGVNGNQYDIPPAFTEQTLEGGHNPLYVAMRYGPDAEGGIYIPTPAWEASQPQPAPPEYGVVTSQCLTNDLYTGSDAKTPLPGFGGPSSGFEHSGSPHGNMESNPHDLVHVYVGGVIGNSDYGLMADPGTAALDPIFYLHHCNIDRMWAQWNANGNSNPTDARWLDGPTQPFVMPWPDSAPWYYTPMQVANLNELNYTYQELSPVAAGPNPLATRLTRLGATGAAKQVSSGLARIALLKQPELLGASINPIVVQGSGAQRVPVKMDGSVRSRVVKSLASISGTSLPDYVYLELQNVRGALDATVLGVYVNLADNAGPQARRASLAGEVALFGLRRASVPHGGHGGSGLTFVLDITHIVDDLQLRNALDVGTLEVSLVPRRALPAATKITVDRINAYRQGQ
jgi:tyrosinase